MSAQPHEAVRVAPANHVQASVPLAGSARSVVLTTLGELVGRDGDPVWTAALLHVLIGLGLEEPTARQAITRGAGAGWISGEKRGREVRWRLTDAGAELIEHIRHRADSLTTLADAWDGNCLVLMVSVPQQQKAVRKRLYSALKLAGFGNPMPGCWVSPHLDRTTEIKSIIDDLGLQDSTIVFVGPTWDVGLTDHEIVRRAWDLDDAASRYESLLATFRSLDPQPGDDLLFSYLTLVHESQEFPYIDPQLPHDLLPNWIGCRATEVFNELRKKWRGSAHARWREIVELTTPASRWPNA